jgi:pimeloyl-ACP methyl ester carboxylesterase
MYGVPYMPDRRRPLVRLLGFAGRGGAAQRRFSAPVIAAAGALSGATASVVIERRHLRRIAADPEYARLNTLPASRPLSARSADRTRLHVEVFGPDDAPSLLLAHGWTEQLKFWVSVIRELSPRWRLVTYDLRGHGRSSPAAGGDYALERHGEDVEAVLAASIREGSRAILVGHSLGAMAIAAWAEHHEVRTRACAAALVNTGFGGLIAGNLLLPELVRWLNEPLARRVFLGSHAPIPSLSSPLQQAVIRYCAFGPTATLGQLTFYERMLLACPTDVRAACGLAMADMDLRPAVARLTVPTLVVAGADDKLTPPSHARRIADALPHLTRLIELPATGHMSPLERPVELSAALAELAAELVPNPTVGAA